MTFLPSVISAKHRGGYLIQVTFNDQSEKTIDLKPWLEGPVFEPLKNARRFRKFFLDGGAIAWPNGADVAPETLYAAARTGSASKTKVRRRTSSSPLR